MQWAEVRAHAARRQVLCDEGERVLIALRFTGAEGEHPIGQQVELAQADVGGQPFVVLWAGVCAAAEIDYRRALVHNATLAVGSIVIDNDEYYIRHAAPLAGLGAAQLDLMIDLVGHEAARLRARRPLALAAEPAGLATSHYAE